MKITYVDTMKETNISKKDIISNKTFYVYHLDNEGKISLTVIDAIKEAKSNEYNLYTNIGRWDCYTVPEKYSIMRHPVLAEEICGRIIGIGSLDSLYAGPDHSNCRNIVLVKRNDKFAQKAFMEQLSREIIKAEVRARQAQWNVQALKTSYNKVKKQV